VQQESINQLEGVLGAKIAQVVHGAVLWSNNPLLHARIFQLGDGVLFQAEPALRAARNANWANMGSKMVLFLKPFVLNVHLF